jgi:cyclopropane fatty-acyl-phospholipid synthase-like methyltransferase
VGRSWKSSEIAAFITALVAKVKPDIRSILDLGVGDGDLAPMLMDRFRGARLVGIDRDETRLGLVEGQLAFYEGKVELKLGDLTDLPLGNGYDLVVSAAALRHVGPDEKQRLYGRAHQALVDGGLFIFGDRTRLASARISQAVRELRAQEMAALASNSKGLPPADFVAPDSRDRLSIADTLYALRKAAFHEVECVFCYGDRAVFAGFK